MYAGIFITTRLDVEIGIAIACLMAYLQASDLWDADDTGPNENNDLEKKNKERFMPYHEVEKWVMEDHDKD
jgi:hypothetical protein